MHLMMCVCLPLGGLGVSCALCKCMNFVTQKSWPLGWKLGGRSGNDEAWGRQIPSSGGMKDAMMLRRMDDGKV